MDEKQQNKPVFDISNDPYNYMMRILFCRWKPYILTAMFYDDGMTHFSKFTKQLPISPKVLAENLRAMEEDGLIYRAVVPEMPPRAEYRLTEAGESLLPLLHQIYDWGWNHMHQKGLPIDALGEMWHGYRERDEERMNHPYWHKKE